MLQKQKPQYNERMFNVAAVKGLEAPVVSLVDMNTSVWAANPKVEYLGASQERVNVLVFISAQDFK